MLIYDRIKLLCKQNGETITGVEAELGFSRGSLCKIDKNKPSAEKIKLLAEHFEITSDFLTGDTDQIECSECGQKYNPLFPLDVAVHETYHKKILDAQRAYSFLIPYVDAKRIKTRSLLRLNLDADKTTKLDFIEEYVKSAFSVHVCTNFELDKHFDYDEFCKTELARLIKNGEIPEELVDDVLNIYRIDKNLANKTDLLLARTSNNAQLMRILAYVERLQPDVLNALEIQIKALAEQAPKTEPKPTPIFPNFNFMEELNAAHERTDIPVTQADIQYDEDMMDDDNF